MTKFRSEVPLRSALIAVGVAAGLAFPREAAAEKINHSFSPALLFSLSLGDKVAFGLGVDFRYTALFSKDGYAPYGGVGPFAQATWLNFRAGRFAAGIHGGGSISQFGSLGLDGELGWTYRTAFDDAHPGGHGIHAGFASELPFSEIALRGTIPLPGTKPEVTIALGARFPSVFMSQDDLSRVFGGGRPLRIDGARSLPQVFASRRRRGAANARLDRETRAALIAAWLTDARSEGSSVPAFLALAGELRALGAPRDLVDRALDAARDEVRHTAACLSIAGDLAGVDFAVGMIAPPPPKVVRREDALARLAVESFQDGCLGEGVAAASARRSRGAVNAMIARDEQRHADLAWSVLAFCLAEGGPAVREVVAAEVRSSSPSASGFGGPPPHVDEAGWVAYGRLDRDGAEASWEQTFRAARRGGEELLSARL